MLIRMVKVLLSANDYTMEVIMRYHDVLGVLTTANETQINNAYNKNIEALNNNGFSSTRPELYSRRVTELTTAKDECIEYIKMPFAKKMELETKECVKKFSSPHALNSCYGCCEGCCSCILIGAIIGGISWVVFSCKEAIDKKEAKHQEKERERRIAELNNRYEQESNDAIQLNNRKLFVDSQHKKAKSKHDDLKTSLEAFESQISIINTFLDTNGINVDLKETSAYRTLYQQCSSASNEEYLCQSELIDIDSELETIKNHEEERQRYLHNNN